ncbi:MAG TPA: antitoxin Xre/MbcA/ParS toxin-binding domain-containing protein [Rhizobiaceae bacterium]
MASTSAASKATSTIGGEFEQVAALFGGPNILKHSLSNQIEAHEMIVQGIPGRALEKFLARLQIINLADNAFESALGMSERTFQRYKSDHTRTLNTEQSSRTWNFARTLTKATSVFGSQAEAERWMMQPAMGLDNRRPIDLLATAAGSELVQEFLDRLDYGVYA